MTQKEIINELKKEVEIPEVVQNKADKALSKIKIQANNKTVFMTDFGKRKKTMSKKKIAIMVAAATLVLGTVSVGATAYMNWSKSLSEGMMATEEQKQQLEETNMASAIAVSDTQEGVTITAQQSIVDNYYAQIAFRVEGYSVEDGVQPGFNNFRVQVGDQVFDFLNGTENTPDFVADGSFYEGLIVDNEGYAVHVGDGSRMADSELEKYTMEDGSMEYRLTLRNKTDEGFFFNKPIHVELSQLGTVAQATVTPEVDATWSFDWTLEGADQVKEFALNQTLDGWAPATVKNIEISPISMHVAMDFQMTTYETQLEIEQGDEDGNITGEVVYETVHAYAAPAEPIGVKLKDGTVVMYVCQALGGGYVDGEGSDYVINAEFDRIMDVDQIASVIFRDRRPMNAGDDWTEQTYEVSLN